MKYEDEYPLDAPIGEISNCLIVRLEDGRIALRGGWDREKALEAALREIHAAKTESGRLYAIQETRALLSDERDLAFFKKVVREE